MDDFDLNKIPAADDVKEPIPFDDGDDVISDAKISHSPLNLGGEVERVSSPAIGKSAGNLVSSPDRITGLKVFYAKLHAGAIDFISGQVTDWLEENPGVVIKRTNVVVGDIASKKTEANLIITVWY